MRRVGDRWAEHRFRGERSIDRSGLSTGIAGGLYIGVGALQEAIDLTPAMTLTFALLAPAAAAFAIRGGRPATRNPIPTAHLDQRSYPAPEPTSPQIPEDIGA